MTQFCCLVRCDHLLSCYPVIHNHAESRRIIKPGHSTPEKKIENATLFLLLGLPSVPIRINRPPKKELFENALQSG